MAKNCSMCHDALEMLEACTEGCGVLDKSLASSAPTVEWPDDEYGVCYGEIEDASFRWVVGYRHECEDLRDELTVVLVCAPFCSLASSAPDELGLQDGELERETGGLCHIASSAPVPAEGMVQPSGHPVEPPVPASAREVAVAWFRGSELDTEEEAVETLTHAISSHADQREKPLVEALEFYADEDNYQRGRPGKDWSRDGVHGRYNDRGETARAALRSREEDGYDPREDDDAVRKDNQP